MTFSHLIVTNCMIKSNSNNNNNNPKSYFSPNDIQIPKTLLFG